LLKERKYMVQRKECTMSLSSFGKKKKRHRVRDDE
jgi:hypothetical protein